MKYNLTNRRIFPLIIMVLTTLLSLSLWPQPALAACGGSTDVATEADLNTAIATFNSVDSGPCTFTIQLTADVTLTAPTTTINNPTAGVELVINGDNHSIDGSNSYRLFSIHDSKVTFETIILQNGSSFDLGGGLFVGGGEVTVSNSTLAGNSSDHNGGGIYVLHGEVTVSNSTLVGNSAAVGGGGIYVLHGEVTVSNSTLAGNSADDGGGIHTRFGRVMVSNSTFAGNSATWQGGGMYIFYYSVTVSNSTFAGNWADDGGGVYLEGSINMTMSNSIIANSLNGGDCGFDDESHSIDATNLDSDGSCDQAKTSTNINLGPLQNNGGPTETLALLPGSEAIDAGDNAICAASPVNGLDQRGFTRPQGANCDIGAFEFADFGSLTIVKEATPADGTDFAFTASGPGFPSTEPPTFELTWGGGGTGNGQLDLPLDVVVDSHGHLYVADSFNDRIQKFDSSGAFISTWGSSGNGHGQFNFPTGVAVDDQGYIYVTEQNNDRVQKFDSSGRFITAWGSSGSGHGQFDAAYGVAVDGDGYVYVMDSGNGRIQKFDSSGGFITTWGSQGSGNGQFDFPYDLTFDGRGHLYVADLGNHRIQKFDTTGRFITTWGSQGSDNGQFELPTGVAIDDRGYVYVTEQDNRRIQKFDSSGRFITTWNSTGSGNGQFAELFDVAVDGSGYLYVASISLIHKFAPADSNGHLNFSLDQASPDDNDGIEQSITFADLVVGTYDFTEVVSTDWQLDSASCTGASGNASLIDETLTVALGVGETVICTFTNSSTPPTEINNLFQQGNIQTSYNRTPAPNAPQGIFTISATFRNTSTSPIHNLHFEVAQLTKNNLLLNADGGPAGAGGIISVPPNSLGADKILSPDETFTVEFEIGLASRQRFNFFVDAYGVVADGITATATSFADSDSFLFAFDPDQSQSNNNQQHYLPLIIK